MQLSDILNSTEHIGTDIRYALFFCPQNPASRCFYAQKAHAPKCVGFCYILMLFTVNRNYFLFLATTTAPAARSATPATAATPSTPVFVLGFVESPVVAGASVAGA